MSEAIPHLYSFSSFHLDPKGGILSHNGKLLPLTQKQFDTLLVLVQNSGRLVRKQVLMEKIWPDTCVEPANLTQNVFVLRRLFAQYEPTKCFIETVARRGYRFKTPVIEVPEHDLGAAFDSPPARCKAEGVNSLAVLPFTDRTQDTGAGYLSEGLADSIINSLSHIQELRVLAGTTVFPYKAKGVDPQEIGRELGVRSVLAGRILKLDDRLIIRVGLIDVLDGRQIWGDQYHRKSSDLLAVQEEISEEISAALKLELTREEKKRVTKRHTEDAEAYRFYLKGRYHWNKFHPNSLRRAIEYFDQAIELDPTYALAYAGLADSYYRLSNVYAPTREAMPKAKAAAIKALEIDETLSEAHAALGLIKLCYEWDWLGAEEEFVRAIEINPNYGVAHQRFSLYFNLRGRFDESIRELEFGLVSDPLSPQIYWSFALTFFLAREHGRAVAEIQKTLEMDGSYQPALYLLGRAYEELGQLPKAIVVFENLLGLNDSPMFLAALGHAYALAGKHQEARTVLKNLDDQSKQRYVSAYSRAAIYLALGDANLSFECLEQAYDMRCEMITWLKVDPAFDNVRTDLRFANLLRRVGLDGEYGVKVKCAAS